MSLVSHSLILVYFFLPFGSLSPTHFSLFLSLTKFFHVGSKKIYLTAHLLFVLSDGTSQTQQTDRDKCYVIVMDFDFFFQIILLNQLYLIPQNLIMTWMRTISKNIFLSWCLMVSHCKGSRITTDKIILLLNNLSTSYPHKRSCHLFFH